MNRVHIIILMFVLVLSLSITALIIDETVEGYSFEFNHGEYQQYMLVTGFVDVDQDGTEESIQIVYSYGENAVIAFYGIGETKAYWIAVDMGKDRVMDVMMYDTDSDRKINPESIEIQNPNLKIPVKDAEKFIRSLFPAGKKV